MRHVRLWQFKNHKKNCPKKWPRKLTQKSDPKKWPKKWPKTWPMGQMTHDPRCLGMAGGGGKKKNPASLRSTTVSEVTSLNKLWKKHILCKEQKFSPPKFSACGGPQCLEGEHFCPRKKKALSPQINNDTYEWVCEPLGFELQEPKISWATNPNPEPRA